MNGTSPAAAAHVPVPASESGRRYAWVATVDHKRIGILYIVTSVGFFLVGGIEALLMRLQLAAPHNNFLTPDAYNQLFTMHGTTMIFLVVMPMLIGFANYIVPLQIGARDMAFPRLNAMTYWLFLFGGLLLYWSFLDGGAPTAGWFSYAPLSETPFSSTKGVDYWILALLVTGTGTIAAGINIIATVLCLRAPGLSLRKLPLFTWMNFINAFLIILALPALNVDIILLLMDRQLGSALFLPHRGGSAALWQHFFWTFGHPEVYIMALPAFGMISEVVPVFSRKPIFGYPFVAASTVAIALLSLGVWAHHMFAVGMGRPLDLFFAASSLLIAVPTGVKVFNWSSTMLGGAVQLKTPMLFAIAFLVQFTLGGLSGVTFATVPLDWQTTDTYYVVAHFHYVLFGGSMFAVFAATYYWFPKMSGRMLSERVGRWVFWLAVIGFNGTFFVQHLLGFMGMPRRVFTYPDLPHWGLYNLISTVGAFVLGFSALLLLWDVYRSARWGPVAGNNPWQAWTLEWATTSPPAEHNFERVPPVRSRRPLWDLAHPERPDPPIGNPARPEVAAPEKNLVGICSFILSEAFFFVLLISAFVYYNLQHHTGPVVGATLDRVKTCIFSVFLFASSFTLWRAEVNLKHNRQGGFRAWWAATILLGLVFIIGQGNEYLSLFHKGVSINTSLFATTFFTLTGFHGLHVCIGLVGLLIVLGLGFAGDFNTGRTEAVRTIGYYWHFVDVVWVFVLTTVYFIGPLL